VRLNDPQLVRRQYETEAGLAVRRGAVARFREGPDAVDAALLAAVEAPAPRRVLEVGCGMGQFAERMLAELELDLVAVDQSPRMVELARERGVDARVGDAQELDFDDGRFECVVANWMLYHVDDLDLALAEFSEKTA
jgi:ubiquinone/menaquinone biosynthesis C-methylase UbiE